jgi:hypothetical protein
MKTGVKSISGGFHMEKFSVSYSCLEGKQILWSKVLKEKLMVAQIVKKFPPRI